ncbi:MAG: hypothetical protein K2L93_06675 [Muribaculaceae bacterium]|nr:hypothetical protein [Muribaculaceae bacterium]
MKMTMECRRHDVVVAGKDLRRCRSTLSQMLRIAPIQRVVAALRLDE